MRRILIASLFALLPGEIAAQSLPNPPLSYGSVPTAGQWNSYFAAKQDVLRFTPLNQAGGSMGGRLVTAASTVNGSGFSIAPGIAPLSPIDGDIWVTSTNLFARIAGITTTFLASNDPRIVGATQNNAAAITGGTINGATIGGTTPSPGTFSTLTATSAPAAGDSSTRVPNTSWVNAAIANGAGAAGAVLYTPQAPTLPQQLVARQNIGARGAGILAKSAAYTVAANDAGKLIAASGTWALTLPSAATAGNGFAIEISNTGTGKITLTPNGSDTIRGAASLVVNTQESGSLVSDGTNWQAVGFTPVIIATSTATNGSYVRWSNGYCVQWGSTSGTDTVVTFPLPYSLVPVVNLTITAADTGATVDSINASSLTATGFTARNRYGNSGSFGSNGVPFNWRAEGFL